MLASLPVHVLPAGGRQRLRPVHVDDLAERVARLVDAPAARIALPGPLVGAAARLSGAIPGAMLTRDTWTMLRGGNTGDSAAITAVLGRPHADFARAACRSLRGRV